MDVFKRRNNMNILVVCGGGASSSFIAQNVLKAAKSKGLDLEIDAISETELEDYVEGRDCILIGPHLKYIEESLKGVIDEYGVPYAFISEQNYSQMNGEAILEQAKEIIK